MIEPQSTNQGKTNVSPLLRGPDAQDIAKIHREITQIANQRFLLNLAAISIFGVIVTWLIPKELPQAGTPIDLFVFAGTFLLLFLLLLLYLYSHMLRRMAHTFTTYLIVMDCSCWESDWLRYRTQTHSRYWAYTIPQTILFMVFGALAASFPIICIVVYNLPWKPTAGLIALGILTISYELFIWLLGFRSLWSREDSIIEKWRQLKARKERCEDA